jgi:hypothetical protein
MEHRSNTMKRLTYHLDARGNRSKRQGWIVYRGFTLDSRKVRPRLGGTAWEIHIHKGPSGPPLEVITQQGGTQETAFSYGKRVVDAMLGD